MRCQLCGGPGPVVEVELNHNVGMLVARRTYTTQGQLCKSCLNRAMFEHTWKNLLLGWWGTISFLMTWVYLFGNIAAYSSARSKLSRIGAGQPDEAGRLPPRGSLNAAGELTGDAALAKLAAFEHNVRGELAGGKLPYDVAEALQKTHRVDFDSAYEFVQKIKKSM